MSLIKQLWLSIAFLMSLAFIGSFIASFVSARTYLEEQLYRKNIDNAASLALTLTSKTQDKTMMELYINSQFDTGHYQLINLVDINGQTIVSQVDDREYGEAPAWLISWFPIRVKPGVAQVSNGWNQVGTLTLSSHTRFAYKQLWDSTKNLFFYFVLISLGSGVAGSMLLRWLTHPLNKAVDHAEAIGERRFITTEEPKTREFKAVIRSMNKLSRHVKTMLEAESSKLEKWRREMQHDKVSGLFNREPALNHLSSFLTMDNENSSGAILLVRIVDLFQLNQDAGRKTVDKLIESIGELLLSECLAKTKGLGIVGRLNGSDFMVVLPAQPSIAETFGRDISTRINLLCEENDLEQVNFLASSTEYRYGEALSDLMRRIDNNLSAIKQKGSESYRYSSPDISLQKYVEPKEWEKRLDTALEKKQFKLVRQPIYSQSDSVMFLDALMKLDGGKTLISAGVYMPHVIRLALESQFNIELVRLTLKSLSESKHALCIRLSTSALSHQKHIGEIVELIQRNPDDAGKLWIEIPEYAVFRDLDGFKTLCKLLKPLNCKVGIGHVRQEALRLGELHDLGLDFVKIDCSLIHGVNDITEYQVFLRSLCTVVHSIGLVAVAEGVNDRETWETLKELGIDGGKGELFHQ